MVIFHSYGTDYQKVMKKINGGGGEGMYDPAPSKVDMCCKTAIGKQRRLGRTWVGKEGLKLNGKGKMNLSLL